MERNQQRIRELEREIATIDACLIQVRDELQGVPPSDPAHVGARKVILRLMDERTAACRTLTALERGMELRPVQH
jgi:hypothetical protein